MQLKALVSVKVFILCHTVKTLIIQICKLSNPVAFCTAAFMRHLYILHVVLLTSQLHFIDLRPCFIGSCIALFESLQMVIIALYLFIIMRDV